MFKFSLVVALSLVASIKAQNLLMAAGGHGKAGSDVEIVNLAADPPLPCNFKPADLPSHITGGTAQVVNGVFKICGGHAPQCWDFVKETNSWVMSEVMEKDRTYAASAIVADRMWITGGNTPGGTTNTTELIPPLDNYEGVDLPEPRERHTVSQIDETRYFIAGGSAQNGQNSVGGEKAWIFDSSTGEYTRVADASEARNGDFAGMFTNSDGVREFIIAGGNHISSSEIYNFDSNTWRAGPNLAQTLWEGVSLEYMDSLLVVGGWDRDGTHGDVGTIQWYDAANNEFKVLNAVLSTPRREFAAALLDDDFVQC